MIFTQEEISEKLNWVICDLSQIDFDNWLTPLDGDQESKIRQAIALLLEADESLQRSMNAFTPADIHTADLVIKSCQ